MNSLPPSLQRAVQRARWLAEVAAALDQASKLTARLCDYSNGGSERRVLRAQILALGSEVALIQRRAQPFSRETDPKRMR